jgi:hypothetical protein
LRVSQIRSLNGVLIAIGMLATEWIKMPTSRQNTFAQTYTCLVYTKVTKKYEDKHATRLSV